MAIPARLREYAGLESRGSGPRRHRPGGAVGPADLGREGPSRGSPSHHGRRRLSVAMRLHLVRHGAVRPGSPHLEHPTSRAEGRRSSPPSPTSPKRRPVTSLPVTRRPVTTAPHAQPPGHGVIAVATHLDVVPHLVRGPAGRTGRSPRGATPPHPAAVGLGRRVPPRRPHRTCLAHAQSLDRSRWENPPPPPPRQIVAALHPHGPSRSRDCG